MEQKTNPEFRQSGILVHPTSFPGPYGIGDLGKGAYDFIDFLQAGGQTLWQCLPLGPTGFGDSPYQSFSAFAGQPTAPADVPVWNPAFDVTPHSLLTGIITERGVLRPPFEPELARLLQTK